MYIRAYRRGLGVSVLAIVVLHILISFFLVAQWNNLAYGTPKACGMTVSICPHARIMARLALPLPSLYVPY